LIPGQPDPAGDQRGQARVLGQTHHRYQTGTRHQIRIIKRNMRNRRALA